MMFTKIVFSSMMPFWSSVRNLLIWKMCSYTKLTPKNNWWQVVGVSKPKCMDVMYGGSR